MTDALPPRPQQGNRPYHQSHRVQGYAVSGCPLAKEAPPPAGQQYPVAGPCQRRDYYPRASVRSAEMSEQSLVKPSPMAPRGTPIARSNNPHLFIFICPSYPCNLRRLGKSARRCAAPCPSLLKSEIAWRTEFPEPSLSSCIARSLWHYPLCQGRRGSRNRLWCIVRGMSRRGDLFVPVSCCNNGFPCR